MYERERGNEDTLEPLNNRHIGTERLSPLGCIRLLVSFIQRCPLYRGVLYSECLLSEVPLYDIICRLFCMTSSAGHSV